MRTGIWILNIFAGIWAALAIYGAAVSPAWLVPVLGVAAVTLWVASRRPSGFQSAESTKRVRRLVRRWSAVEGASIVVAVILLANTGHKAAIVPAIAILVGLHFFPLARGIPLPSYYATGAALVLLGAGSLALAPASRAIAIGAGGALILWLTSLILIPRGGSKRSPAS